MNSPSASQQRSADVPAADKGALAFMVFQGTFKTPVFVVFLQRLLKQIAGRSL